jgi:hypothetical protein
MKKNKFVKLLQKEKKLRLKSKKLSNVNKLEYDELTSYKIILSHQVFSKNQLKYINLVKNCLAGTINCYEFQ